MRCLHRQKVVPGSCGDPECPVLHADPANPIHPPFYRDSRTDLLHPARERDHESDSDDPGSAPVRAQQAATHPAGTQLRCPTCGTTITATGLELAAICTNGDRHRATRMERVEDCASRERGDA